MDFLLSKGSIFENPEKLPLNELNLEVKQFKRLRKVNIDEDIESTPKGTYESRFVKVPALDPSWIQKDRIFHLYQPYYTELSEEENNLFVNKNMQFVESLDFLLQASYQQFWCYVEYEPKVVKILKSFVYNATPWFELQYMNKKCYSLYVEIFEKVLQIFFRLLEFEHSEVEHMTENTVLKILQDNNMFTFSLLLRLCLLCNNNKFFINEWLRIYIKANSNKYLEDVKQMFNHALLVFEMIGGHICGFEENTAVVPLGIGAKPKKFDPYWYLDVAILLLDTVTSINSFLTVYPQGIKIAESLELPFRLTYFYDRAFPSLQKVLERKQDLPIDWSALKTKMLHYLQITRSEFANCFHFFVSDCIDNIVKSQGKHIDQDRYLDKYVKLLQSAMSDEYFIFDYHNAHEVDMQLQTISDFFPEHDRMRTDYIIDCLNVMPRIENDKEEKEINVAKNNNLELPKSPIPQKANDNLKHKIPSENEIDKKINNILDTLPHLGDGFILKCLAVYNYNTEEVLSAILDQNLSPQLDNVPTNEIRVPSEPEPEKPILAYKGKKPTYKDTLDLLNDKSDLADIKREIIRTTNIKYDMYDDEYDDRDDTDYHIRLNREAREEEDNTFKYMENRFEGYELVSDPSESSSEEEGTSTNTKEFCKDPALLRRERENQRKYSQRKPDVVGKAKGQGQDKSVIRNRDKKTVNKSTRSNHNRKAGAQFKRNKGMF